MEMIGDYNLEFFFNYYFNFISTLKDVNLIWLIRFNRLTGVFLKKKLINKIAGS